MTIVLIGYMGSGKTTIGNELSNILGYQFEDLDAYIEKQEGQSISELFQSKGEIYFRKVESKYLVDILKMQDVVISLGGGTPCYGNNMQAILSSPDTISIYLKASIPTLVERLKKERKKRPLISHLKSDAELTEFVGKHLFERNVFYNQSNYTVSVENKSIKEIVEAIVSKLF